MAQARDLLANKATYALILVVAVLCLIAGTQVNLRAHEDTADATIETNIFHVGSTIPGTVTEVLVDENQKVRKGQVLARLDETESKLRLRQAEAALTVAREQAESARMQIERIREFSVQRKDKKTAAAENAELQQAQQMIAAQAAQLKQANKLAARQLAIAEKRLSNIRNAYTNIAALAQNGAESQISVQQAQMTMEMAQMQRDNAAATIKALQVRAAQLQQAARQARTASQNKPKHVDPAVLVNQLSAARSQYNQLAAAAKQAEVAVEAARLALRDATITSPSDGIVVTKTLVPSMRVQPGQPLVAIIQPNPMWITANFDEKQIARIQPGQRAVIRVAGNPDAAISGRVSRVASAAFLKAPPQTQPASDSPKARTEKTTNVRIAQPAESPRPAPFQISRTVPVRIDFDSRPQHKGILPGMSASVSVQLQ